MTHDESRQVDAFFRTLERDEEQYMKAARAVQEQKMEPSELALLWSQLTSAHEAWIASMESRSGS